MVFSGFEERKFVIIDDDIENLKSMGRVIENFGAEVALFDSPGNAIDYIGEAHVDVVVTDMKMPHMDGMEIIKRVRDMEPSVPVIVITAYGSIGNAVDAVRRGATDYLQKPVDIEGLRGVLIKALRARGMMEEIGKLREMVKTGIGPIIYRGPEMERVVELVRTVAPTKANVLILGESGTGKELVARAIHEASKRQDGKFIPINCAALTESILESELFGHERGAFTGAVSSTKGKFELAAGGTLFLDEVGEIPLPIQAKLLRAIEQKEIMRVGGEKIINVDVRIVAATNSDLKMNVTEGKFREDLYYRLSVFSIEVPPLRDRRDDIPQLVIHFIREVCADNKVPEKSVSVDVMEKLKGYAWPGNVRELKNTIETMVLLSEGDLDSEKHLPADIIKGERAQIKTSPIPVSGRTEEPDSGLEAYEAVNRLRDLEKKEIEKALSVTGNNKTRAAKMLGIGLSTLYRKMKEYEIA